MQTYRLIAVAALAAAAFAQGPQRGAGGGQPALDMSKQTLVEGAVSAVHIGLGMQYPSIEVNKRTIKLAPAWFLMEKDFELKEGDLVKVAVVPSAADPAYLYAITIAKTATNAQVALRNQEGFPLWMGPRAGSGGFRAEERSCGDGPCIEAASVTVLTGTVDDVTAGRGIQHPKLVLKSDGKLVTIALGPERVLLAADFEIRRGDTLKVKAAKAACCDDLVALELTNAAGVTLVLRDANGYPAW